MAKVLLAHHALVVYVFLHRESLTVGSCHISWSSIMLLTCNPNAGDTPLMLAVESEMTMAVTKLAKEGGADVNQGSETTGE